MLVTCRTMYLFILFFGSLLFSCHGGVMNMEMNIVDKGSGASPLDPVPAPLFYKSERKLICISLNFDFKIRKQDCPLLRNYVHYIHSSIINPIFSQVSAKCEMINVVEVSVEKPCNESVGSTKLYPSATMDESYKLNVTDSGVVILATEVWGAMRALETLSQLLFRTVNGEIGIYDAIIIDKPRFSHRGLMLDTSRHFISKANIMESLKLMAMNKMNVFHWHIVDDNSFPYSSTSFPELADKGAYNAYTSVYTQEDIADVIEFGRRLGIRVMPEFDSPGHTQSWGKGQSDLLTACYTKGKPNGQFGPVDPSRDANYDFLKSFFAEVTRVFPEKLLHLGGDEVSFSCWQSNPAITAFMKKQKLNTYADLESYYVNKLLQLVGTAQPKDKGLTPVVWQEVFDNKVKIPTHTFVHVWKSGWQTEMDSVTKAGYNTILSTCWYLNYISYGSDYQKYYNCDPQNFNGTDEQNALVLGGEACMWGEFVDNSNVISRTWPRASSVAEALWTMSFKKDFASFQSRMQILQCRMLKRGFLVEPPNGPSSCDIFLAP